MDQGAKPPSVGRSRGLAPPARQSWRMDRRRFDEPGLIAVDKAAHYPRVPRGTATSSAAYLRRDPGTRNGGQASASCSGNHGLVAAPLTERAGLLVRLGGADQGSVWGRGS